jgi:hypothetical protein
MTDHFVVDGLFPRVVKGGRQEGIVVGMATLIF